MMKSWPALFNWAIFQVCHLADFMSWKQRSSISEFRSMVTTGSMVTPSHPDQVLCHASRVNRHIQEMRMAYGDRTQAITDEVNILLSPCALFLRSNPHDTGSAPTPGQICWYWIPYLLLDYSNHCPLPCKTDGGLAASGICYLNPGSSRVIYDVVAVYRTAAQVGDRIMEVMSRLWTPMRQTIHERILARPGYDGRLKQFLEENSNILPP